MQNVANDNLFNLKNENFKLKSENNKLKDDVNELKSKVQKYFSKIRHQDENFNKLKTKTNELVKDLEDLESSCLIYKDDIKFYKKELTKSLETQGELNGEIDELCSEISDLKDLLNKTENERNIALVSAEKLQEVLVNLKSNFKSEQNYCSEKYEKLLNENNELVSSIEKMKIEISKLQTQLKASNKDVNFEKNFSRKIETQMKEFISQNKNRDQQLKKLEEESLKLEEMKKENKRVNNFNIDLRKKLNSCENELKSFKSRNQILEELVSKLKGNIKKLDSINLQRELGRLEKKIPDNVKKFSIKKRSSSSEDSSQDLNRELKEVGFEEERRRYLEMISGLEGKLSDIMVVRASLEAQVAERNSQATLHQKEIQEKISNLMEMEKEIRIKNNQIKISEDNLVNQKEKVRGLEGELEVFKRETLEKKRLAETLEKDFFLLKTKHEEVLNKIKQLEEDLTNLQSNHNRLSNDHQKVLLDLKESERTRSNLEAHVSNIAKATDALKFEIQQSNEHNQILMDGLQRDLQAKIKCCEELEKEKKQLKRRLEEFETSFKIKENLLQKIKNESKALEFEIKKTKNTLKEKNENIEKLKSDLAVKEKFYNDLEVQLKNLEQRKNNSLKELTNKISTQNEQIEILKTRFNEKNELNQKLKIQLKEKEELIDNLSKESEKWSEEKAQFVLECDVEVKRLLKDLKQEKKYNDRLLSELDAVKQDNYELSFKMNEFKDLYEKNKNNFDQISKELMIKNEENKNLTSQVDKIITELKINTLNFNGEKKNNDDLNCEVKALKSEVVSCKTLIEQLKYENEQNETKVNKLNEILSEKMFQIEKQNYLMGLIDFDSKEKAGDLEYKVKLFKNETNNLKKEISEKETQIKNLQKENKNLYNNKKENKDEVLEMKKLIDGMRMEINSLKIINEKSEKSVEDLKLDKSNLRNILDENNKKEKRLNEELDEMREKIKNFIEENERMKEEIRTLRVNQIDFKNSKSKELKSKQENFISGTQVDENELEVEKKNSNGSFHSFITYNSKMIEDLFNINHILPPVSSTVTNSNIS